MTFDADVKAMSLRTGGTVFMISLILMSHAPAHTEEPTDAFS